MSVKIESVSKIYKVKGGTNVTALNGISFELPDTGMVFILGKSGCGKSTLLNLLGGLDGFDSGDILIDNQSIKSYKANDYDRYRNHYVGFVFQENNLLEEYTVKRNIGLALDLQNKKNINEQIEQVLDRVALKGFKERKCNSISGGQKQRVAIARALVKQPKILLCDEPTGALDSETGSGIFNLLKEISRTTLVVVVSHDRESAEKYADRIIELKDGVILSDTKPLNEQQSAKIQIKTKNGGIKFNRALTLGLSMLKSRPVRFAVCILICLITFVSVGIASEINSYNRVEAIYNTMLNNKSNHINVTKYYYDYGWQKTSFDKLDVDELNREFGVEFDCLYDGIERLFIDSINFIVEKDTIAQYGYLDRNFTFSGIIDTDENLINKYGYILHGNLPRNNGEAAIPLHIYKAFEQFGYRESKFSDGSTTISDVDDIIGKTIVINEGGNKEIKLTISGVVDTGINTELYGKMYDLTDPKNFTLYSNDTTINRMLCGMHRALFVSRGFNDYYSYQYGETHLKYLIAPFGKAEKTDLQILNGYSFNDTSKTEIENEARYDVEAVDSILAVLSKIFLYVSIVVIIITVLYVFYYISGIITENNKKIGIMRSIGAARSDIYKIFALGLSVMVVGLIIVATVLTIIVGSVINSILASSFGISAILIKFGIKQFAILSAVAVCSVLIGIVLPLANLLKSKPIDIMSGRK